MQPAPTARYIGAHILGTCVAYIVGAQYIGTWRIARSLDK